MTNEFSPLNLHPNMVKTLTDLGYTAPTPIQSAIIPVMQSGQDVIGQAQTGTGKTAAFSLPILQNLSTDQGYVQSLVMTPTRELAIQVANAMYEYGRYPGASVLAIYGGQPYIQQIRRLRKGVDIVVGTPGRLLDLIQKNVIDLGRVSTVVLDEADEMLSMGFISDIEAILEKTPATRQTALFSATLPQGIRRLAGRYLKSPESIAIGNKQLTVASVDQRYYVVNEADKLGALTRLFEIEEITSALIFVRTRLGTGDLVNELAVRGFSSEALNGDLSQDARGRVLDRFRNNQIKVLVATDVAARGLDIDDISHVINFDMPQDPEVYVHRIGRTGRAGKAGIALSLLTPKELWRLRRLEKYIKQKMTESTLPTVKDIQEHRKTQLKEKMMTWLQRGRCREERYIVTELIDAGHDLLEIAAVSLKMARGQEKQRPIIPISEIRKERKQEQRQTGKRGTRKVKNDRPRNSHEKGMVRLSLNTGNINGLSAKHVVGTLSHFASIPGNSIGKVSIQKKYTLVDVPEKFVAQILSRKLKYRIGRQSVSVRRAS